MNGVPYSESETKDTVPKRNVKICILSLIDIGIDGRTMRQIKTLNAVGFEVTAIYHQKKQTSKDLLDNGTKTVGLRVFSHRLPKHPLFHLIMYVEFCIKAIRYALNERADVYQGNNLDGLLPAFVTGYLSKARVVYDSQEIFTDMQGVKPKFLWRLLEAFLLNRVDAVLDVNSERARLQRQRYALAEEPIVVMNCPELYPRDCLDGKLIREKVAELGYDKKSLVLYQGAIMRGRYLDNLIRAMRHVRADALLVFMGPDVRYLSELRAVARSAGVYDRVLFLDPISPEKIVSFVSGADIGVLFYENTCFNNYYCAPTKLYEYLMAGLPILVNDMPHLRAVVDEEQVGRLVEAGNAESIARGIDEILESNVKKDAMSKRAREVACRCYNWAAQSDIYLDVFRKLTE